MPPARAAAEVESIRRYPAVQVGKRRCRTQGELFTLLDARSAVLRRMGMPRVERRTRLPPREFFDRYYFAHRPVLLQGLTDGWPALRRWRPDRLARRFGEVKVEVMVGREADPDHDLLPDSHRRVMKLGDFIRRVLRGGPSNDCYLTARNDVLKQPGLHAMADDIRLLEGYLRPWTHPGELRLWVGPAGTRTALHHDINSLLFVQIHGRKRFRLMPSYELHRMSNSRGPWSDVDADRPDLDRFPAYREATVLEVVVGPGEALFIPVGWWHQVLALDVSVSLTFDAFAVPGGNTYWELR